MDFAHNESFFIIRNVVANAFFMAFFIIYLISILIIFPIYVYVHNVNKKIDKTTHFYPITDHFFFVICSMQVYVYLSCFISLAIYLHYGSTSFIAASTCFVIIGYVISTVVTNVQNVLLFVLSFRRFALFFFPGLKKLLTFTPMQLNKFIRILYVFYILLSLVTKVVKISCSTETVNDINRDKNVSKSSTEEIESTSDRYNSCVERIDMAFTRIYLTGDVLVMLAAVFYALMFFKVRKWSKILGDPLNKPEKYIFYQTLLIVITKLMTIITNLLLMSLDDIFSWTFAVFVYADVAVTPLIIQGSYILCNRANIEAVLSINFRKLQTWKIMFCGAESRRKKRRKRRVQARNIVGTNEIRLDINVISNKQPEVFVADKKKKETKKPEE